MEPMKYTLRHAVMCYDPNDNRWRYDACWHRADNLQGEHRVSGYLSAAYGEDERGTEQAYLCLEKLVPLPRSSWVVNKQGPQLAQGD